MVEKGRDRDRERDQGQPEARASLEKVEKEVKKTRGASHLEKTEVRASDEVSTMASFSLGNRC